MADISVEVIKDAIRRHLKEGPLTLRQIAGAIGIEDDKVNQVLNVMQADKEVDLRPSIVGKSRYYLLNPKIDIPISIAQPPSDSGGPAFPVPQAEQLHDMLGMSLRDYFASHAPPVPDWFPGKPKLSISILPTPANWRERTFDLKDQDGNPQHINGVQQVCTIFEAYHNLNDSIDHSAIPDEVMKEIDDYRAQMQVNEVRQRLKFVNDMFNHEMTWRWTWADAMVFSRKR